jgi:hypothetical protein
MGDVNPKEMRELCEGCEVKRIGVWSPHSQSEVDGQEGRAHLMRRGPQPTIKSKLKLTWGGCTYHLKWGIKLKFNFN